MTSSHIGEQRPPSVQRAIEQHLETIVHSFIRRPLVQLFDADNDDETEGIGSGTLLRGASGRIAILTAHHVLDGVRNALIRDNDEKPHRITEVYSHPKSRNTDIAIGVVDRAPPALEIACLDTNLLATSTAPILRTNDTVVAIGYPSQLRVSIIDEHRGVRWNRYGDMIRRTVILGFDRNAMSLEWREAEVQAPHLFASSGIPDTGSFKLKKPSGISGGAVWWQDRSPIEIWTAESVFRLVGVLHEFTNGHQLAVPATRWATWVRETLAKI